MGEQRPAIYYDAVYRESQSYKDSYKNSRYLPNWKYAYSKWLTKAEAILDIGCGTGQFAEFLHDTKFHGNYTGIDFSQEAIGQAKNRAWTWGCSSSSFLFECLNVEKSPDILEDANYSHICLFEVLEHIDNDLELLSRIKPGTTVVGSVPCFDDPAHVRTFKTAAEIIERYGPFFDGFEIHGSGATGTFMFYGKRNSVWISLPEQPKFKDKTIAVVLTNSREDQIAGALESLYGHMDGVLIIDTGVKDKTLEIAEQVVGKDRLHIHAWLWRDDFSAARNEGLRVATELGARWAVFLDTDMRYQYPENIRPFLDQTNLDVVYITTVGGFSQPLIQRLPTKVKWNGRAHNALSHSGPRTPVPYTRTWELRKTPEAQKKRFEQSRDLLLKTLEETGPTARLWYYLGDSYAGAEQVEEAIGAFRKCSDMRGWDEESAWACYRTALLLETQDKWQEALDECGKGLVRHAGVAELAWRAGYISWKLKKPAQAAYWGKLALVWSGDSFDEVKRAGFRDHEALRWGAWDVLRFALKAIGDTEGAKEAEEKYQALRPRE